MPLQAGRPPLRVVRDPVERGAEVIEKLRDLFTTRRHETERELLRSIARGFRAGPSIEIPSELLAEKFDAMADEVGK